MLFGILKVMLEDYIWVHRIERSFLILSFQIVLCFDVLNNDRSLYNNTKVCF